MNILHAREDALKMVKMINFMYILLQLKKGKGEEETLLCYLKKHQRTPTIFLNKIRIFS